MSMKDNETIKALEKILQLMCCDGDLQKASTVSDALDLIKRKDAEIKKKDTEIDILIRKKETLKDELAEKQAENERLKDFGKEGFINILGNCLVYSENLKDYNDMRKGLKVEAYQEFAERLKNHFWSKADCDVLIRGVIDNLVTELTKGDEGK